MRTLVIGIPLPHSTFDNYSFLSAPSISEYTRLVVEMSSVTRIVDEVIQGSVVLRTFGGQVVVNGPPSADSFSLSDVLAMRQREAERFFAHGGTAVCIAHPDVMVAGIVGTADWTRYQWLSAPKPFDYRRDLLPGFGKDGAELVGAGHHFHRYLSEFAAKFRYRTYAEEETIARAGGVVLARSAGGMPIAFELPLGNGRIIFAPPLLDPAADRGNAASALLEGFDDLAAQQPADVPEWIRKEVP
jgi:hypothetical protein